jgi:type VII secretion-associated serine protease mycosin
MRVLRAGAVLIACVLLAPATDAAAATSTDASMASRHSAGRIAVTKSPQPEVDPDHVLVRERGKSEWKTLATPGGRAVATVARLERDPTIAEVAPNYRRHAAFVPNDKGYGLQTDYLSRLRIERAWERSPDGQGVTIAILDSGIDANHPEFFGRVSSGYDFVNDDSNPNDDNGHGTMVAGVAAAAANNKIGIAGIAYKATILPIKVLDEDGAGDDADLIDGIEFAVAQGADVINMSLGGPANSAPLNDAIDDAIAAGVVVVAAAGNSGAGELSYPAAYDPVLAVGATGDDGTLAYFSTWGWWVDIAAPGVGIVSTYPAAGTAEAYEVASGTSFSSPIVAGVAAMARSEFPGDSVMQIADRLKNSARDRGPYGIDPYYGAGTVDALGAVGGLAPAPRPRTTTAATDDTIADSLGATGATKSITPEGDEDWFFFTASVTGPHRIRVTPSAPSGVLDPRGLDAVLELYDDDQRQLKTSDETIIDEVETLEVTLTAGSSYYVRVRNYHASISSGTYAFLVSTGGSGGATAPGDNAWIDDTWPENHSVGQLPSIQPFFTPDRALDAGTITTDTVVLLDGRTGAVVPVAVDWDSVTIELTPDDPLPNGPYIVRINGVEDTDGNALDAWYRFGVGTPDITSPSTSITSRPASTTTSSTARFRFSSTGGGVAFLCRLDKGSWHSCSSPKTYSVPKGKHTFKVLARDAAGNEDPTPATATWTRR